MAAMKKFRVVLDITINDDNTGEPRDWLDDQLDMNEDEGEAVVIVEHKLLDTWESGDDEDDDDDAPSCPFDVGDRIKVMSSTSEIAEHLEIDTIEASRIAGHTGKVTRTDPGDDFDVLIDLDNGENVWINNEHLSVLVETAEGEEA